MGAQVVAGDEQHVGVEGEVDGRMLLSQSKQERSYGWRNGGNRGPDFSRGAEDA